MHPIYLAAGGNGSAAGAASPEAALEGALFGGEGGLRGALGCDPRDAAVLLSGLPGELAAHLTRRLTHAGVAGKRILFADFL